DERRKSSELCIPFIGRHPSNRGADGCMTDPVDDDPPEPKDKRLKTTLIQGTQAATMDAVLLSTVDIAHDTLATVWNQKRIIGLRNEDGEVYRAIGTAGRTKFIYMIKQLRKLGCTREIVDIDETQRGFHAILSAPGA
ncbi:MAG TPA: hypothetical protein VGP12_04595, partial [Nitrosospira sp.]|nr:hypothetical protein [Nitrosospira sp.]